MTDFRTHPAVLAFFKLHGPVEFINDITRERMAYIVTDGQVMVATSEFTDSYAWRSDGDHLFPAVMKELAKACDNAFAWDMVWLPNGTVELLFHGPQKYIRDTPLIAACEALLWVTEQKEKEDA